MSEIIVRIGLIVSGSIAFGIWQASIAAAIVAAIVLWIWVASIVNK